MIHTGRESKAKCDAAHSVLNQQILKTRHVKKIRRTRKSTRNVFVLISYLGVPICMKQIEGTFVEL